MKFPIYRVGRVYSAHFKYEASKGGLEHILKKLHRVQNVGNLLPFLPQSTESEKFLLYSHN
jgi:hypothetical protein